ALGGDRLAGAGDDSDVACRALGTRRQPGRGALVDRPRAGDADVLPRGAGAAVSSRPARLQPEEDGVWLDLLHAAVHPPCARGARAGTRSRRDLVRDAARADQLLARRRPRAGDLLVCGRVPRGPRPADAADTRAMSYRPS